MLVAAPDAFRAGKSLASDRSAGQNMLFGGGGDDATDGAEASPRMPLPETKPWDRMTRLAEEKESLGFFISGHPLDDNEGSISEFCNATTASIGNLPDGGRVVLAGVVNRVRPVVTRTGSKMAMSTLTDKHGTIDAVIFSDAFAKHGAELQIDRIVAVVGSLELGRGEPQIVVDEIFPVEDLPARLATRLELLFDESVGAADDDSSGMVGGDESVEHRMRFVSGHLKQVSRSVQALSGRPVETVIHLRLVDGRQVVMSSPGLRVVPTGELVSRLRDAGADGVRVRGGHIPARPQDGRRRGPRVAAGE